MVFHGLPGELQQVWNSFDIVANDHDIGNIDADIDADIEGETSQYQ
jgi:hypothetical protein